MRKLRVMATTLSVRVFEKNERVVLLPWAFIELFGETCTVQDLFDDIKAGKFHVNLKKQKCENLKVLHCTSSTNHKLLEEIVASTTSNIIQKCKYFNMLYFTVHVEHDNDCETCKVGLPSSAYRPSKPNAFQLLMASANAQKPECTPIESPKTAKEEQYNAVLKLLNDSGCAISKAGGRVTSRFVQTISNAAWYIDGHTHTMERESSRKFPECLKMLLSFNKPEKSKHRKRKIENLSREKLFDLSFALKEAVQSMQFAKSNEWCIFKIDCLKVAHVMEDYARYLAETNQKMLRLHATPQSDIEKKACVKVLPVNETPHQKLRLLNEKVKSSDAYVAISVLEYLEGHVNRKQIYETIHNNLQLGGLSAKCVHYVYVPGGQKQALHFVWRIAEEADETEVIQECVDITRAIEKNIPHFERRVTKKSFEESYGFLTSKVALRSMFRDLSGDGSAPINLSTSEIDRRLDYALLCEDTDILVDLRNQPPKTTSDKFKLFFEETERYLSNDVGVACHDRRHGEQLYLAKAVSFSDLRRRVKELVPEGTEIPSVKWLRYQFQPLNPRAKTSSYYKARIQIKMMVQKRQVSIQCNRVAVKKRNV